MCDCTSRSRSLGSKPTVPGRLPDPPAHDLLSKSGARFRSQSNYGPERESSWLGKGDPTMINAKRPKSARVSLRSPWRLNIAIETAAAILYASSPPAVAQSVSALEAVRSQLIGARPRTWVRERVVLSMGSHGDCSGGETYRFNAQGTVTVTHCIDRKLVRQAPDPSWTITRIDALDTQLAFDGRTYMISFGGSARAPQMRWHLAR